MKRGALWAVRLLRPERCPQCQADRDPNGEPRTHVSGHRPKHRAQSGSQRDSPSCELAVAAHNFLQLRLALRGGAAEAGRPHASSPTPRYAFGNSDFGALSPICRTLPSSSDSGIPESVSNNAGICAAILVMSPVILFIPAASPFPVETIVILSTFASGAASAFTTSGMLANNLSITAAWLYS